VVVVLGSVAALSFIIQIEVNYVASPHEMTVFRFIVLIAKG
jgi:hypothetical protein